MFCNEYKNIAILYLYNELTKYENDSFENHLKICKVCVEELSVLKETVQLYKTLPNEDVSPITLSTQTVIKKKKITLRLNLNDLIFPVKKYWRYAFVPAISISLIILFAHIKKSSDTDAKNHIISWSNGIDESLDLLYWEITDFKERPILLIPKIEYRQNSYFSSWNSSIDHKLFKIDEDVEILSEKIEGSYF